MTTLHDLFLALDQWVARENVRARTDGTSAHKKCTIRVLGQAALWVAELGLTLDETAPRGELLRRIRERQELLVELDRDALLDIVIWARTPVRVRRRSLLFLFRRVKSPQDPQSPVDPGR